MKNPLEIFRKAGSFIAGLLIGLSLVVFVFAMMVVDPSDWQTLLGVLSASLILALGLTLHVVLTIKPRGRRTISPELGVLPARFVELKLEQ